MPLPADAPALSETHTLGMAEMGVRGLSENWLLRRAGDLHWRLIARAMGQRGAVFTCAQGKPLYAAFCASQMRLTQPSLPQLGDRITLTATLTRVGRSRLASETRLALDGHPIGHIRLISTFVGHGRDGDNRSILRRAPRVMVAPPEAPARLVTLAQRAARIAAAPPVLIGEPQTLLPCPAMDFNAAGLLYFPSFTALAERAAFARGADHTRLIRARDVVYLGNVDPGAPVSFRFRDTSHGHLAQMTAEGRPLALILSRYV